MRAYIFRASELKISEAFIRVRRRVLISPTKFFELIKQLNVPTFKGGQYDKNVAKSAKAKMAGSEPSDCITKHLARVRNR